MDITYPSYFLGAISAEGFKSYFEPCLSRQKYSYIIKGGPGCGKSTAMKSLSGPGCEHILCSSDPQSLDGILLPNGTAVFDGTAPHVLEPEIYGVTGEYLSFLPPVKELSEEHETILKESSSESRAHYAQAYRLLSAHSSIIEYIGNEAAVDHVRDALEKRALGISKRELKPLGRKAYTEIRFINGNTPFGPLCIYETAELCADRIWDVKDSYGAAGCFFEVLLNEGIKKGHHIIVCNDATDPNRIRHLIFPKLRIAFVSSTPFNKYEGRAYRRVIADKYCSISSEKRSVLKSKIIYAHSLLKDACAEIGRAKKCHDAAERIMKQYTDFSRNDAIMGSISLNKGRNSAILISREL